MRIPRPSLNLLNPSLSRHAALLGLLLLSMGVGPAAYAHQDQAYTAAGNISVVVDGNYRIVQSKGLPDHQTGQFPNAGNPNTISEQDYTFRIPLKPKFAATTTPVRMNLFGVAINGVPFDPGAAEWWNHNPFSGWQYEAMSLGPRLGLDENNAHVQPNGAYHYHGLPKGVLSKFAQQQKPVLIGYAADGFPIYGPYGHTNGKDPNSAIKKLRSSYRIRQGTRPNGPGGAYDGLFVEDYEYVAGSGDLDDCNGRFDVTSEYPHGTYLYVITDAYPYVPRGFKGTPDSSFEKGPPARRGQGDGPSPTGGGQGFGPPPGGPGAWPPPGGGGFGGPQSDGPGAFRGPQGGGAGGFGGRQGERRRDAQEGGPDCDRQGGFGGPPGGGPGGFGGPPGGGPGGFGGPPGGGPGGFGGPPGGGPGGFGGPPGGGPGGFGGPPGGGPGGYGAPGNSSSSGSRAWGSDSNLGWGSGNSRN